MPPKKDTSSRSSDNDVSSTNSTSQGVKTRSGKRKYVMRDDYEEDLDNQMKKFKDLESKFDKLINKQKKLLESKINANRDKINRNIEDIEELYDNYEEGYFEDGKYSDDDTTTNSKDKGNKSPHIEVISGKIDFGKQLMSILTGKGGKIDNSRLDSDITKILEEQDTEPTDEKKIRAQCKIYADSCKELKINFSYEELKHFITESDEYKENVCANLSEIINKKLVSKEPYTLKVMNSMMDAYTKQLILMKVNQLNNTEPGMGDYYKLKRWVDTALAVPWGKYKKVEVISDKVGDYLSNARGILDKVIYGQEESKDTMIQIISKLITNTNAGNVFSLYGPAGVGKTTIIKNGLAKALDLPFAFISLGGATDASYLDGHSYTYEGSIAGKIVDIITKSGCMNPIIYFDELDKVSNTPKGREIMNMLIHLTDPVQSSMFQDKYLGSIDIDLSKCIFVFSFNHIEKVNRILLDRMKLIYVKGFTTDEKMVITRDYLLPDLLRDYNLYYRDNGKTDLTASICNEKPILELSKKNIKYIITYGLTNGNHFDTSEEGVRQIKQRVEKICSLINIVKITNGKWNGKIHSVLDNIPELKEYTDVTKYPIKLDNDTIGKMLEIKTLDSGSEPPFGMYS
jgi:ATP-dependent Lon protease